MGMIKLIYGTYKAVKTARGAVTAPTSVIKKLIRDFAIKKIISVVVEDVIKAEEKDVEFLNKKYSFTLPSYLEKIGKDEMVKFLEEIFNDGLTFSGDITGYNAGDIKIKLVNNTQSDASPNSKIVEIELKLGFMKDVKNSPVSSKPSSPVQESSTSPVSLKEVGTIGTALDVKVEVSPPLSVPLDDQAKKAPVKPKTRAKKVSVTNLPEIKEIKKNKEVKTPAKKVVKKALNPLPLPKPVKEIPTTIKAKTVKPKKIR